MSDPNRTDSHSRAILPISSRPHTALTTYDAKDPNTKFPPIEPLLPPKGAPNVLIVLLDDVGFAASSAFGGPCQTPNFDRLASGGLKYNRFHTAALCSPTRQACLTGRNHHSVGMGGITEIATSAPGYCSVLPKNKAPLAMTLKLNGYSTAQFGKCHEVPVWQTSPMGPFDQWPTGGGGFEYFYGFIGGETNQWDPGIYEGTTDKAISWVGQQKALMADKPFFVYFAPGACHAPHHVPKEWADKYKGKFDQGWDKLREESLARQKKLGVVPQNAELTKRPKEIQAWDEVDPKMKPVLAREMEVYAGFLEHTDHHVGRLIDTLKDLQILDDTLIYVIIGDNGASAEGTTNGTFNELLMLNGITGIETPEFLSQRIDKFGSPRHTTTMPWVGRTPWTLHISGPNRSLRTGAARAMGRLCTGPRASRRKARFVHSSATSSTSPRLCWKSPAYRSRRSSTACSRRPWKASACRTRSTTRTLQNGTSCNILRCSATGESTIRDGAL
jgi:arylsulfatase A-like enzyme